MAYKTEAANVRANLKAGNYKEKIDPWIGFFDEVTYSLKKADEVKRQEEIIKRKEKRDEAKAIAKKQAAEEKLEKEREELANFYLQSKQQSPTVENRAALMSVIKGGKFTDFSDLDAHMKSYSTYTEGTPQSDIDAQMAQAGLLQKGDGPFEAITEEVNNLSSDGTITFTGKKPDLFDLSTLREDNWEGNYQQLIAKGDTVNAERVQTWAVTKDFFKVAGGYTKKQLMAMPPVSTDGKEISLETVLNTSALNEEERTLVNGILTVKNAELDDNKIYSSVEKLLEKDLDFLMLSQTVYDKNTAFGRNIATALETKQALQNSNDLATLSTTLEKDVPWYDNQIELNKTLDETSPFYEKDLKSLQSLITLRSMALEQFNKDDLEAEIKLSTKERFLRAKYEELGYFIKGTDGLVKVPDSAAMANIESTWKRLTDISEKEPEWFTEEKLLSLPPEDLKVIIDTGMLDDKPDVIDLVKSMYESREQQADSAKLSTALDPSQQSFSSTTALDAYVAGVGPERMNAKAVADFARVRAVLAKAEGKIENDKDINAYQVALKTHLSLPENVGKQGQELIDLITNWETTWKDSTSATKDFSPITLFRDGDTLIVNSQEKYDEAIGSGEWSDVKLGTVSQMLVDIPGITREQASMVKNNLIITTTDGFGRPQLMTRTGEIIPIQGAESNSDAYNRIVNSNLSPEEIEERRIALEEMEEALGEVGFAGRINKLDDVLAAFGPEGFTGKIVNKIGGVFGGTPMKDAAESTKTIYALGKITKFNIISGFAGLRDSVSLKAEIETLLPKPGKFITTTKPDAIRDFNDLKALLDQAILAQENIAKGRNISTTKVSGANVALESLRPLSKLYGQIIEKIETQSGSGRPMPMSFIKKTNTN